MRLFPKSAAAFALVAAFACAGARSAAPTLDVVGADFPELLSIKALPEGMVIHDDNVKPTAKQAAAACAYVRAKKPAALGKWAHAIVKIDYTCEYEPSDIGDGLTTTATATLRPGTVRMFGVPVVEVRLQQSDWGYDFEYILDQPFKQAGKALIAKISAQCRKRLGHQDDPPCKAEDDKGEFGHGGYLINGWDNATTWLHPEEKTRGGWSTPKLGANKPPFFDRVGSANAIRSLEDR